MYTRDKKKGSNNDLNHHYCLFSYFAAKSKLFSIPAIYAVTHRYFRIQGVRY